MRCASLLSGLAIIILLSPAGEVAGQALKFEDATALAGMTMDGRGQAVAVRDYDQDGWPDLFVVSVNGRASLFRNRGDGTFEDVAQQAGLDVKGRYLASAWADIDNDGWADLAVVGEFGRNRVFRSRGDGTFEDLTDTSGVDPEAAAASLAFGDFDSDGLVDLFLPVQDATDLLYRNLGNGRFEDVTQAAGVGGSPSTIAMQATWFDFDHDGRQDLFVVHDGFAESRLHRNYGFLPLIDQARATSFNDIGSGNSMGIAWGDVNGDGWEDVYITRIGEAGLYINQEGKGFLQIEDALGAWRNGMSWGTVFSDFDNDLDPDLFVVSTSGYDGTETLLYENRGGWFVDQSQSADASFYVETQGLASWDFDRDGRMDLVFPGHDGPVRVLRGIPDDPGNWLKVSLQGTDANRDAIGARVEARVGDRIVTGHVSGGDSFCSQSEPIVHLGLGDATRVDELVVHWGGGQIEAFGVLTGGYHGLVQGGGAPSGTATAQPPEIVRESASLAAFPNPITADTRLRVSLPEAQHVRIALFDARGREVALLAEENVPAGTSVLGLPSVQLGSGIYFIKMETPTGVVTTAVAHLR